MANYMFILRPIEKRIKTVCLACASRGEVIDSCRSCGGNGVNCKSIQQYYVQDRPIPIKRVDRDPKTGILRYWEDSSDFYYETVYPELNHYVPEVPHGVHLCHDDYKSAHTECERINKFLKESSKESFKTIHFERGLHF
jgi:RecJ-like exonuclease